MFLVAKVPHLQAGLTYSSHPVLPPILLIPSLWGSDPPEPHPAQAMLQEPEHKGPLGIWAEGEETGVRKAWSRPKS